MSKKRDRDRSHIMGLPEESNLPSMPLSSLNDVDRGIYGDIEAVDSSRLVAEPIDIHSIYPDPVQPRRILPLMFRNSVQSGADLYENMPRLWTEWENQINQTRFTPLNIEQMIYHQSHSDEDRNEDDLPEVMSTSESILMEIIQLAASILRDGLTNPITVVTAGPYHHIETGERRWLAYHLLYHVTQDSAFMQIPARVVNEFNVWRQASENNARQNLNAIGKARQFALLMMDLWQYDEKAPRQFSPMGAFETDREFYAQVGDMRPPYGKADQLLNALGAQTSATFTRCRKLLSLPDPVWDIGDLMSLPEDTLLKLEQLSPEQASNLVYQMYETGNTQLKIAPVTGAQPNHNKSPEEIFTRTYKQFPKIRKSLKSLPESDRNRLLDEMQDIINEWRGG